MAKRCWWTPEARPESSALHRKPWRSEGFVPLVQLFLVLAGGSVHVHGKVGRSHGLTPDDPPNRIRVLGDLLQQKRHRFTGILLVVVAAALRERCLIGGIGIYFDRRHEEWGGVAARARPPFFQKSENALVQVSLGFDDRVRVRPGLAPGSRRECGFPCGSLASRNVRHVRKPDCVHL